MMKAVFLLGILCSLGLVSGTSRSSKCVAQFDEEDISYGFDTQVPLGSGHAQEPTLPLEVVPLIVSGPYINRVDLVFFSDGYLLEERDKFLADARYLAEDISGNQTFNTVKPLLNFWAAFTPSEESGVGVGGKAKKTPFGLYRDGTELRGVYTAYPEVADAACESLYEQCDFPILLGNDPLYGGLGGKPTIITSSVLNGPQILRHELGHSIIPVGEEYDGGYAYFGVNAYHNLSEAIPWAPFLSKPEDHKTEPRVERSVMPLQNYAWTMLNTSSPWSTTFQSSGMYARHLVRMSLSGLPEKTDLKIELDGEDLKWEPKVGLGVDRWHYDFHHDVPLSAGEHEVVFTLLNKDREGIAQMCSIEILEFGDEDEFISTPGHYGVYPTYSEKNETSYRPTNEDCLMRIVTTPNFCKVCLEGLWHALLQRLTLIDNVSIRCQGEKTSLEADLVPLAQFREGGVLEGETYTITWSKDGHVLDFTNKTSAIIAPEDALGKYLLEVELTTPEVKVDREGHLKSRLEFEVSQTCKGR
ncbi:hypothetical protein Moror_12547 [Moniliophthora roreri MCA 2997]|uniref:IgA Peptidase M64 n=2 Tax=Moniliophthora roreri TaxID=221103 RepID=V2XT44_MONRO|nr:hypothetical protein Moror_12547 [Moniliophthora roreri MCA 2997]